MMSATGRLIINKRGEAVSAIHDGEKLYLFTSCHSDRVTLAGGGGDLITGQFELSPRDARALILQIADAIGDACELTPRQPSTDP
jgi:hypothetical protein